MQKGQSQRPIHLRAWNLIWIAIIPAWVRLRQPVVHINAAGLGVQLPSSYSNSEVNTGCPTQRKHHTVFDGSVPEKYEGSGVRVNVVRLQGQQQSQRPGSGSIRRQGSDLRLPGR